MAHQEVIEFGDFRFETATPLLTRNSRSMEVAPKALEILRVLVRNAGQVVSKDEILSLVWPDEVVEEGNLAVHISALRKALGQNDARSGFIETIPKRGYRFATAVSRPPSIAVLPFENLSLDTDDEYLGEGLAEEIINALCRISELRVIARTSAFSFKDRHDDIRAVADALQVSHIVHGSVRNTDNRLRITVKLIEATESRQLWSQTFDQETAEIFRIQDEITRAIANALRLKAPGQPRRTESLEAYQSYIKAVYYYQRLTGPDLWKAKECLEEALRYDPGYALAYAGLAIYYYNPPTVVCMPIVEARQRARSALEKALGLDPALPEAHCILGMIAVMSDYDWRVAEREFRIALAMEPVSTPVRYGYTIWLLLPLRRFDEAAQQCHQALETDPLSGLIHFAFAYTLCLAGDSEGALKHAAMAAEICQDSWLIRYVTGIAQWQSGMIPEAICSFEQTMLIVPGYSPLIGMLAGCYALAGNRCDGERLIQSEHCTPSSRAIYHAMIGEPERMLECLEAALAERDQWISLDVNSQAMTPYRSHPRFRELLHRMHLD